MASKSEFQNESIALIFTFTRSFPLEENTSSRERAALAQNRSDARYIAHKPGMQQSTAEEESFNRSCIFWLKARVAV